MRNMILYGLSGLIGLSMILPAIGYLADTVRKVAESMTRERK